MTNPRRHCGRPWSRSLRKSVGKRGKRWKEFDRGERRREEGKRRGGLRGGWKGGTLKELVYASGDDHSPLITWTIVQGQRRRYTWEWKRIERGKERGTFARLFGSGGCMVKHAERPSLRYEILSSSAWLRRAKRQDASRDMWISLIHLTNEPMYSCVNISKCYFICFIYQ